MDRFPGYMSEDDARRQAEAAALDAANIRVAERLQIQITAIRLLLAGLPAIQSRGNPEPVEIPVRRFLSRSTRVVGGWWLATAYYKGNNDQAGHETEIVLTEDAHCYESYPVERSGLRIFRINEWQASLPPLGAWLKTLESGKFLHVSSGISGFLENRTQVLAALARHGA